MRLFGGIPESRVTVYVTHTHPGGLMTAYGEEGLEGLLQGGLVYDGMGLAWGWGDDLPRPHHHHTALVCGGPW